MLFLILLYTMNNPVLSVSDPDGMVLPFPSDEINALLQCFSQEELFPFHVIEGEVLTPEEGAAFFLMEGVVEVLHTHSRLVIDVIDRVFPVGIIENYYTDDLMCYKAKSSCLMYRVDKVIWNEKIKTPALCFSVCVVISYSFFFMTKYSGDVLSKNNYRRVRQLIYQYESQKEMFFQLRESISEFILSRVKISRSQVMKILSELRKGEYIHTERGYLMSINRKLPLDF